MAVTSSKRRSSFSMRRTSDWVMSADVPTDVTIDISGTSFTLHKFPLVARSGRIRRMVAEARDPELSQIQLAGAPGGAEAFELAAKFCYGINFEITASNVASLRCMAEYLEMTEDYGRSNLSCRADAYLTDVVLHSLGSSITVLHTCEKLLPVAEEVGLVSRCVQSIGSKACQEQIAAALSKVSSDSSSGRKSGSSKAATGSLQQQQLEWWAEELSILNLDLYQRVLGVMKSQGMPQESLWRSLMHYAQCKLSSPDNKTPAPETEQRLLVETIVSLLPPENSSASCGFLFGLLRTAIVLDSSVTCRLELERRISTQLDEATLDDLLIPSFSYTSDTLFDTEIVHRIVLSFFRQPASMSSQVAVTRVAKLVDCYLSEVAPDANLKLSSFISLAGLLPDDARSVHDGLYRAIDIYLKAHPTLGEAERKRVCKLLDTERLSQEASNHAAQNDRLPAHFIIQVLYFEQLRLKTILANFSLDMQQQSSRAPSARMSTSGGVPGAAIANPSSIEQAALRKENRELKVELSKMKLRLAGAEEDPVFKPEKDSPPTLPSSSGTGSRFFRKLGKLNPFARSSLSKPPPTPEYTKPRIRRHSMS